jgi:hypothetical protein
MWGNDVFFRIGTTVILIQIDTNPDWKIQCGNAFRGPSHGSREEYFFSRVKRIVFNLRQPYAAFIRLFNMQLSFLRKPMHLLEEELQHIRIHIRCHTFKY